MTTICSYGCGNPATTFFKRTKRWCCSISHNQCPAIKSKSRKSEEYYKERAQRSARAKRTTITEEGISLADAIGRKIASTKMQQIDQNGLNAFHRAAAKMINTKDTTIDINGVSITEKAVQKRKDTMQETINGKSRNQISREKWLKTMQQTLPNGKTRTQVACEKTVKTNKVIGQDGLNNYQRAGRKAFLTKIQNIGEDGLNAFDRSLTKTRKGGYRVCIHPCGLPYQGSHEKRFIDNLICNKTMDWVKEHVSRGPAISYIDPTDQSSRTFYPDFIIDGTIYEIKSSWTWNNNGRNTNLMTLNIAKLNAATNEGYTVTLVLDGVYTVWSPTL